MSPSMSQDQSQPSSFVSFVDILGRDALRDFLAADLDVCDDSSLDDYDHDHPDDAMASYWPFRRLFSRRASKDGSSTVSERQAEPNSESESSKASSSVALVDSTNNVSLSRSPPASSFVASSPHLRPCSPPPCQLERKSSYSRPSSLPPVDRRKQLRRALPIDGMKRSNSTSASPSFWTRPSSPIPMLSSPTSPAPTSPTPTAHIPHCPLGPSPPATTVGIAPEWDWYWRANHGPRRPQSPLQYSPFTLPSPTPVRPLPRSFSYQSHRREISTS